MTDKLYTRAQTAKVLGVNMRTVDRLAKVGKLTPRRSAIGRGRGGTRIYFDAAQVEALLNESAPAPSSPKNTRKAK